MQAQLSKRGSVRHKMLEACLRLMIMWCFNDLRDVVVNKLERLSITSSRKLELARTYDIRCWYRLDIQKLALCSSALTPNNLAQIGPELALMVYRLKEKKLEVIMRSGFYPTTNPTYATGRSIETYSMVNIQREFKILLDSFAQTHHWDDQTASV